MVEPSPATVMKMEVLLQCFLPLLVRFSGNGSLSDRKVWAMSYNVVSDNLGLPEWSTQALMDRYKNAIQRSAEGTLTELKLLESQLQAMNAYSFQVYFNPPWRGPSRP
jgi:hypothetical protein